MKFPLYHRFIVIISIAIIINIVLSIWISPLPIIGSIPRESYTEDDSLPSNKCVFRTYPPNRYYYPDGLINYNELPDFLTQSTYIRGKKPIILNEPTRKLCTDTPWENQRFDGRLPYSDGFNPSLLPLSNVYNTTSLQPISNLFGKEVVKSMFLSFLRFGDSQCSYRDNNVTKATYNISTHDWLGNGEREGLEPALAIFLNSKLETIDQSNVFVELDADFGIGKRKGGRVDITKKRKLSGTSGEKYEYAHVTKRMDDIRAIVHQGQIWISYYGPDYGFDNGNIVLNRLYFDNSPNEKSKVYLYIKASEVQVICCGRNVALFSDSGDGKLKGVSWIDPLTVETIEKGVQLKSDVDKKSSFIHGTNDKMIHLPHTSELLGIGHFHRPKHIKGNTCWIDDTKETCKYALYGHHYTHALYTISDRPPHVMTRLSNEFMFPRSDNQKRIDNAHVIQFASGLSIVGDHTLLISYGINDCEPAIMQLPLKTLESLLMNVTKGTEVRDLMIRI